jgi:predicted transcriptional regulator
MPKDLSDLTDLHLLILGALWSSGESSIAGIHSAIAERHGITTKTIATLLGRLEKRKLVSHRMEGREGVYRALVTRREVLVARIGGALASVFAAEQGTAGVAALSKKHTHAGDEAELLDLLKRAEQDVKGRP